MATALTENKLADLILPADMSMAAKVFAFATMCVVMFIALIDIQIVSASLREIGRQPAADFAQRRRDDLDVDQRDEHADAHGGEGEHLGRHRHVGWQDQVRQLVFGERGGHDYLACSTRTSLLVPTLPAILASLPPPLLRAPTLLPPSAWPAAPSRLSTSAVTDRPGRKVPSVPSASSSTMRTGTRWTILVKLPVAFSGG